MRCLTSCVRSRSCLAAAPARSSYLFACLLAKLFVFGSRCRISFLSNRYNRTKSGISTTSKNSDVGFAGSAPQLDAANPNRLDDGYAKVRPDLRTRSRAERCSDWPIRFVHLFRRNTRTCVSDKTAECRARLHFCPSKCHEVSLGIRRQFRIRSYRILIAMRSKAKRLPTPRADCNHFIVIRHSPAHANCIIAEHNNRAHDFMPTTVPRPRKPNPTRPIAESPRLHGGTTRRPSYGTHGRSAISLPTTTPTRHNITRNS